MDDDAIIMRMGDMAALALETSGVRPDHDTVLEVVAETLAEIAASLGTRPPERGARRE